MYWALFPVFRIAADSFEQSALCGAAATEEDRAVIVVTGLRMHGPGSATRDLTVAEGATVTVTPRNGEVRKKKTAPLAMEGRRAGTWFTADFPVDLGTVYDIVMTFQDGTAIRIDNYQIPANWKTHLQFHNTRGTKSPASILRKKTDEATGLSCYVYVLWPVTAYEQLTARTLGR